ncbi:MAG: UDP-3-O-[3-hydroxymyristoyl] N-acetylglucosamine deacetylase [Candidatus Tectomicrobia bacterium]|nr:UDP-3-O-[3-hydroxymyristoyl] N-acetylglucosamine deacetylase [Candidatus Tectomicrobia bacterium]
MQRAQILIVDDEPSIQTSLAGILSDEGFEVRQVGDGQTALAVVHNDPPDLVLLDIWLPGMDGLETLQAIRQVCAEVQVIMMSGHGNIDTAVKATKLGAFDYIEKPFSINEVLVTVNKALEHHKLARIRVRHLEVEADRQPWLGRSAKLRAVRRRLLQEAQGDTPLLIVGEVGAGKEFAARFVHAESRFREGPFYKVLCSTLPHRLRSEDLLAACHPEPAATNGKAPLAAFNGGSLFLDNVDQLLLEGQTHLLELLRSAWQEEAAGFRLLVSATNPVQLSEEGGLLRSEFFADEPCRIPALRDCRSDLPLFLQYFITYFANLTGRPAREIDDEALAALVNYSWPGNVKELKTTIERVVLATPTRCIHLADLPYPLRCEAIRPTIGFEGFQSLDEARRAWEREFISYHLKKNNWELKSVAERLRMDAHRLERKVRSYGLRGSLSASPYGRRQRTLKRSVVLCGQGLHSGLKTGLILLPLPPNSGINFGSISSGELIPAHLSYVSSSLYATCLQNGTAVARTVEHLMAVLHMYQITNLLVKMNDEVPIMDGSAIDFCQLIEDGGIEEQDAPFEEIVITDTFSVDGNGAAGKRITIEPSDTFRVEYTLEYPPPLGRQTHEFVYEGPQSFRQEIAPARTFGFVKDFEVLGSQGLAGGGRLDNVILIDDGRVINTELRYPNELVRHKILDIIGDFYLLGRPVRGKIVARMTGHTENAALLHKIKAA